MGFFSFFHFGMNITRKNYIFEFSYSKSMTKFEAFVLEHFIKHKLLIFEECNVNFLDEEKKSPASMNKTKSITKCYYFTSPFFKKSYLLFTKIYII